MKKRELETLVRGIVREEVNRNLKKVEARITKAFKETLNEVFDGKMNKIDSPKKKKSTDLLSELIDIPMEAEVEKSVPKRNEINWHTGDPALNNILENITEGIPAQEGLGVMPLVEEVSLDNIPKEVANAMTRDYSELMEAMDKKDGR